MKKIGKRILIFIATLLLVVALTSCELDDLVASQGMQLAELESKLEEAQKELQAADQKQKTRYEAQITELEIKNTELENQLKAMHRYNSDGSVSELSDDIIKSSKNLFNKVFADTSTENEVNYTDYIYLSAGTYCYSVSGGFFLTGNPNVQWYLRGKYYNLDKTPKTSAYFDISESIQYNSGNWYTTFTVSEDCYLKPIMYISMSSESQNILANNVRVVDYIQIELGSSPTVYEEYWDSFKYPKKESPNIGNILQRTKNLFDKDNLIDGVLDSNITLRNSEAFATGYTSKNPIPITSGETYTISLNGFYSQGYSIVILDSSCMKNTNAVNQFVTAKSYTFTASFSGYLFISAQSMYVDPSIIQVEKSDTATEHTSYYEPTDSFVTIKSKLAYKTMYVFGDSIMAASSQDVDGVAEQLALNYYMGIKNYAHDGYTITNTLSTPGTILDEIAGASSDIPDYVLWNGGTNDISNWDSSSLPIGAISDGYSVTLDDTTFCGAFEKTIKTLMTKYPGARIVYCTTHVNAGRDLADQNECWDLTRQMCNKWGIQIADVNRCSGLNSFLTEYKGVYTDAGGTHPNTLGYKLFYIPVIENTI